MYQWDYTKDKAINLSYMKDNIKEKIWEHSHVPFLFYQGGNIHDFIPQIQQLTTEQTEASRLLFIRFYYSLNEYLQGEFLKSTFFDMTRNNSWILLVNHMTKKAQEDVLKFQQQCKSSPDNAKKSLLLSDALHFYYEGLHLIQLWKNSLSTSSEHAIQLAQEIIDNDVLVCQSQDKLVALKPHYENLNTSIQSIADIQLNIPQCLAQQLTYHQRIDFSQLHRFSYLLGKKAYLKKFANDKQFKEEELKNNCYQVFNEEEASEVKQVMSNTLYAISGMFEPGIIHALKRAMMILDKEAYSRLHRSHISVEDQYEDEIKSIQFFNAGLKKEQKLPIPSQKDFMPLAEENIIFNNNYSLGLTKISDSIVSGFEFISEQLSLNNGYKQEKKHNQLVFSQYSPELIVGQFNRQDKTLLAYKFNDVYENAISTFVVPNSMLEKEIPSLEFLQQNEEDYAISCFRSYGQMIADLKDDYIQEHFLKGTYEIIDNIEVDLGTTVGIH